MKIEIWDGTSNFSPGQTPFGFYDTDVKFSGEADKVAKWMAGRLGYPVVDVELPSGSLYAAFEEAITVYGNEVYQYKIRENYNSFEGNSTSIILNDKVITPSLGGIIRIAETYGSEAGTGGNITYHKGSIQLSEGNQNYDLKAWAQDQGISGSIEIKRLYHSQSAAIQRFYDPYAGVAGGGTSYLDGFGIAGSPAGINFMMMPLSYDVMRAQAIEFGDEIRRSAYSFNLINNQLSIFPTPSRDYKLWFDYIEKNDRTSIDPSSSIGPLGSLVVTDVSNVPYENPVYGKINSVGKQFIFQYGLSIAKEMLGYVRKKYDKIPIPNGDAVVMNGDDLIGAAKEEKAALLLQLRDTLNETSRKIQLERRKTESDLVRDTLANVPLPFYVF